MRLGMVALGLGRGSFGPWERYLWALGRLSMSFGVGCFGLRKGSFGLGKDSFGPWKGYL